MKRFTLSSILFSFVLISCAGQSANAQAGEPTFLISTKNPDDQIEMRYESDIAIFSVFSPSGIGSATIDLVSGQMPKQIVIQLHLKGLEEFRIASAVDSVKASISSSDPSHVNFQEAGRDVPILPVHPLWLKIEIVSEQAEKTIPLEDGFFEVTVPDAFIRNADDSFQIDWIDFYR